MGYVILYSFALSSCCVSVLGGHLGGLAVSGSGGFGLFVRLSLLYIHWHLQMASN